MVVFTGSTVEEAIQKGLKELDIPRMKAHIKVISRRKKAFLVYLVKNQPKWILKRLVKRLLSKQINR